MIIDSHCHIYPDKIAQKATDATGRFYDLPMFNNGSVSMLLSEGEKAGIDKFIVESVATTPRQVGSINRFVAKTVLENPGKMIGLGTLHPNSENIEEDVDELISLGLKGVKLHPDIQGFKLDDFRCLKIYEICEKRGLPVLIHTGDKRYDNSNPNRLIPILDIYDKMTVIGAHFGGYSVWDEASKVLPGRKNLYVDCSSSFQDLTDDEIRNLISLYGADRVLFGTDYPMWNMKEVLDRLLSLGLNSEDLEKILHLNAEKIYGI